MALYNNVVVYDVNVHKPVPVADVFDSTTLESLAFNTSTRVLTATMTDGVSKVVTIPAGGTTLNTLAFNTSTRVLTVTMVDGVSRTVTIPAGGITISDVINYGFLYSLLNCDGGAISSGTRIVTCSDAGRQVNDWIKANEPTLSMTLFSHTAGPPAAAKIGMVYDWYVGSPAAYILGAPTAWGRVRVANGVYAFPLY